MKLTPKLIFFPGIIFHELSHYIACILMGVEVKKVEFFGKGDSYVVHGKANLLQSIIITTAPFILGNIFALIFLLFAKSILSSLSPLIILFSLFSFWFAVSFIYYSFPSQKDAQNTFDAFFQFFHEKVFESKEFPKKIFWAILTPFMFVPMTFLLGIILLFDKSRIMSLFWGLIILLIAAIL